LEQEFQSGSGRGVGDEVGEWKEDGDGAEGDED
jgi:hypothetical protein